MCDVIGGLVGCTLSQCCSRLVVPRCTLFSIEPRVVGSMNILVVSSSVRLYLSLPT